MQVKDKTIIICFLARDVETSLKRNLKRIDNLRKRFNNSWCIAIENDSKDNTKRLLSDWSLTAPNIILDIRDTNSVTIPPKSNTCKFPAGSRDRIQKMANFRNRYLEIIKANNLKSDFVLVIDIDLDDFSPESIIYGIENAPDDWRGLFANGVLYSKIGQKTIAEKYYDTFALIPYESETYELTFKEQYLNRDYIVKRLKDNEYLKVKSAFGGIGVYRYQDLINLKYTTADNNRSNILEVICEHISICRHIDQGLYICKNMKAYYQRSSLFSLLFPAKFNCALYPFLKFKNIPQ